jgi:transcriptional regulator with XRE-family HTH domain
MKHSNVGYYFDMGEKKLWKNNLKVIRKERGLTQKKVAALLGLQCEDRLSHWEKGVAMPSVTNLFHLANVYQVPIEDLYKR